jgi:UrcA family protein
MFTKSLTTAAIAAGLAGLALCTQPAAAQSAAFQPAERLVSYADLDLATTQGQARLEARLHRAANAVCEANYGAHPLNEAMEARRCYRSALQSAHRQIASIANVKMVSR